MTLGKLDLSTRDAALKGGEHGPALKPGSVDASRLWRHVNGLEKPAMPLNGKLTAAELADLSEWIRAGAAYPANPLTVTQVAVQEVAPEDRTVSEADKQFWSFRRPVKSAAIPSGQHPVDFFLERARKERGLPEAPRASRETLLRRAYLDLIGLPPTPRSSMRF